MTYRADQWPRHHHIKLPPAGVLEHAVEPWALVAAPGAGVDLCLDQQNIDTTTPVRKLLFQLTGAFAEFERSMIRQRVRAGYA